MSQDTIYIDLEESSKVYQAFQRFYPRKRIPHEYHYSKKLSSAENLFQICLRILDDKASAATLFAWRPLTVEIVARLISDSSIESKYLSDARSVLTITGSKVLGAISRISTVSPEAINLVEYFLDASNFFASIDAHLDSISQDELQGLLLAFYRLLATDRHKMLRFIDPTTLQKIIQGGSFSAINKLLSILLQTNYLSLSEEVKNGLVEKVVGKDAIKGYFDGDEQFNYQFLPVFEAQRLSNLTKLPELHELGSPASSGPSIVAFDSSDFSAGVRVVGGVLVPHLRELKQEHIVESSSEFVGISKSLSSLREMASCIRSSEPLLLIGQSGSGKTFLVHELGQMMGVSTSDFIKIHLNQQTDPKLLLGTYTSGEKPGTFEWKNGVLTTAVKEGKWILIEDIDKAPSEVLSILLSLLSERELPIPSRGEVIRAANGFQLIATIQTHPQDNYAVPDIIGHRLWHVCNFASLETPDLQQILNHRFPLLKALVPIFIKTYFRVQDIYTSRSLVTLNDGAVPRPVSIRDLMKFCRRSDRLLHDSGLKSSSDMISDNVYDEIFEEAIDCFTSALPSNAAIKLLTEEIGKCLEIPTSRIELQLQQHTPKFEDYEDSIRIGRSRVDKNRAIDIHRSKSATGSSSFARTNHSLRLMEKVGMGIEMCEPLVLVGETGTGKTTVVQEVAKLLNKKITVINVSQQTDAGDLLGGFKPVSAKLIALPIEEDFEDLFHRSFSAKKNGQFLKLLAKCFNKGQWKNVIRLWKEAYKMAKTTYGSPLPEGMDDGESAKKKRRLNDNDRSILMKEWDEMNSRVGNFDKQFKSMENSFIFQFVEGALVKAVKNGDWLLLDEINLASSETLDSISDLLSEDRFQRSILLSEKGDIESIGANPGFRIFGCMNPATDVGKRELPTGIRSKFTEIYVHSPDEDISDLLMIIDKYIGKYALTDEWVGNDIAELYLESKQLADNHQLVDGANQKPQFSIRTLTRTLIYVQDIVSTYGLRRSLFEGFSMSFLTLLDQKSAKLLEPVIRKHTVGRLRNADQILRRIPANPGTATNTESDYVQFKYYWIKKGPLDAIPQDSYIITPFVEQNLLNLVRATSGRRFPVLLQGPTSAGKTSMINYLAKMTGHKFVRINNHEHTDLQEYLGTYVSDDSGKLSFKEGVLVEALRNGYWLVLDELNLAPTDVLEALNRLLDDNRELFIPETQEVVRPHPEFMLFATQNPPGLYGGRKFLSKAFRNRFLELHFDDIPQDELEIILRERCKIAPSYAKKIVAVYKELSVQRQSTRLFEQKNSFATLRDLFRWAQREAIGYDQLAANGYMLLAERVRRSEEKDIVKHALEKVMRVKLDIPSYYHSLEDQTLLSENSTVIWTKAMRRLAVLVNASLAHREPILLVGETGCGKTTICQILSTYMKKELIIVNAHQNTETSDLLGAQRPVRNRSQLQRSLVLKIKSVLEDLSVDASSVTSLQDALSLWDINKKDATKEDIDAVESLKAENEALFEWSDGPLISAMKDGSHFLLDEISLADDSVLERLNSVLEPERTLLLAEKGSDDALVVAQEGFQFFATMNPGGDYGKKELSPALRNRFTEIWVPSMEDFDDVSQIVSARLNVDVEPFTSTIVDFCRWYAMRLTGGKTSTGVISLRDVLAWVQFINSCTEKGIEHETALLHGACMVFIDALGTHNTSYLAENEDTLNSVKLEFVKQLSKFASYDLVPIYEAKVVVSDTPECLNCGCFSLRKESTTSAKSSFSLTAPTTASNAMRVVRALQVSKPVLLEGSPGVGKTSLITALASSTGTALTRINLSEQTDLIDLFGSDSPVEGGRAGEFTWRDGPFLRAMQKGEWVLLDEMNLASQSVLEGLNACLDHRGEVYIPELERSFTCHPSFRVFAAQNPQSQGGGRKGLPKSFVNRFTVVYVETLKEDDLALIAGHLYPTIEESVRGKMIGFMAALDRDVVVDRSWGTSGQPWEFNLRDTLRWLSLMASDSLAPPSPTDYYLLVIRQRFRTPEDRKHVDELYESYFGSINFGDPYFSLTTRYVQTKHDISLRRQLVQYCSKPLVDLQCNVDLLETIMRCVKMAYPCLLVGPSGAGKTELIKYAANIMGARVVEFSMNSDIDSMDILGGFEQADVNRTLAEICNDLVPSLNNDVASQMTYQNPNLSAVLVALELLRSLQDGLTIGNLSSVISGVSKLGQQYSEILHRLQAVQKEAARPSVNFKWFDGLLVQAVEKGYWLILDNSNLCSASVLDRLNSLLELNGKLIINECTNEDGTARTVIPHPDFRLFLTSDPKYGELSRAMRNRAVEVFVGPLSERVSTFDALRLGIPSPKSETDVNRTGILSQLSSLQLKDSAKFRPLSCFTQSVDSAIKHISGILDIFQLNPNPESPGFRTALCLFTEISDLPEVVSVAGATIGYSEFASDKVYREFADVAAFLGANNVQDSVYSIYKESLSQSNLLQHMDCDVTPFQSFCTSLNEYIMPFMVQWSPVVNSAESHYLIQDWSAFYEQTKFLTKLQAEARRAKVTTLNPLQRSAAQSLGRDVKKAPKIPLYDLVSAVYEFVSRSLSIGSEPSKILKSSGYFEGLFELIVLWQRIVQAAENADVPYLRAYQETLNSWIESQGSLYDSDNISALQVHVSAFKMQIQITRGQSIDIIWSAFRANYPSSDAAWSLYETVLQIASKFDEVAQQQSPDTYGVLNQLRTMLIEVLDSSISEGASPDLLELTDSVSTKIDELEMLSNQFLIKRSCAFTRQFDSLLAFVDSEKIGESEAVSLTSDVLTMSLLANRSTSSLLKLENSDLFKPYPRILDSLWSVASPEKAKVSLFSDEFLKKLLRSADQVKHSSGGKIDDTLYDVKFMIKQLVLRSHSVLSDHRSIFTGLAKQWVFEICKAHNATLPQGSFELANSCLENGQFDEYVSIVSQNGLSAFSDVFAKYLGPCLQAKSLGSCWIMMCFGFILLYVPDAAYDPSTSEHVAYQNYLDLQAAVTDITKAFSELRRVQFGDTEIYCEHLLPSIQESQRPEKPEVFRPSTSAKDMAKLSNEWCSFFDSYLSKEYMDILIGAAENCLEESNAAKVDNFGRNASSFILRLQEGLPRYADLNDILCGFIGGLRLGFELLRSDALDNSMEFESPLWMCNASILTSAASMNSTFNDVKGICKSCPVSDSRAESLYCQYLDLACFHASEKELSDVDGFFNQSLLALYYRWSLRRLKQEEEESMQQGVYKFNDPTMDAEADFERMFPDADELVDATSSADAKVKVLPDALYYKIADSYVASFSGSHSLGFKDILDNASTGLSAIENISQSLRSGHNTPSELVSMFSIYDDIVKQFSENPDDSRVDFYHGSSPAETKRANDVVKKLQGDVHKLIQKWPEHATLQDLFRICTEFVTYPVATPIARLLAKIEQIYTYLGQWEDYAHSGVSLKEYMQSLATLIVGWRKLELSSWNQVLNSEENMVKESTGKWWFHLFETILLPAIKGELDEEGQIQIVGAINIFVSQGTYGDYSYRLEMLAAFSKHISLLAPTAEISQSLLNVITFYKQFEGLISETISRSRTKFDKDVKEVILLASWKDVNVEALKQSSRKSHQSLYKIIRKYRAVLSEPVKPIITGGLSTAAASGASLLSTWCSKVVQVSRPSGNTESVCAEVSTWAQRSSRLRNIIMVSDNMSTYISNLRGDRLPRLSGFADDLIKEANRLRKETPSQLSKDNKKLCNSLKTQKRKLFSDTLKELKRMGIKLQVTSDVQKALSSVTGILATSLHLGGEMEGIDAYYFRLLELLPRLRNNCRNANADIPPAAVRKSLAAAESLITTLITIREPLANVLQVSRELTRYVSDLTEVSYSTERYPVSGISGESTENAQNISQWMPKVLQFALDSLSIVSSSSGIQFTRNVFEKALVDVNAFSVATRAVYSNRSKETLASVARYISGLQVKLASWASKNAEAAFVADFVLEWISQNTSEKSTIFESSSPSSSSVMPSTLENVEESFRSLLTSIMLSVQGISKVSGEKITTDDDRWLQLSQRRLTRYYRLLCSTKIMGQLRSCVEVLSSVRYEQNDAVVASALVDQALPLIKHYKNLVSVVQGKLVENYEDLSSSTYKMSVMLDTISKDGFCSPEPPSEKQDNDQAQEGTGLGDGEGGAQANDIEDDEDFDDDAMEENKEKGDKDDADNDNDDAVDIEGDMAGDLENAEDQEDEDSENEDEEDEEEELDDEIDDIDDSDPNAIDEKMWDEKAAEDSKEKESDKMPQNSTADNDDLQGAEGDDDQKKQDGDGEGDNQEQQANDDDDDDDAAENDDQAEEEEDVGEQDDQVQDDQDDEDKFDDQAAEGDALELPEDIDLDDGEGNDEEDEEDENEGKEGFDDGLDMDSEPEEEPDKNADDEGMDTAVDEGEEDDKDGSDGEEEEVAGEGDQEGEDEENGEEDEEDVEGESGINEDAGEPSDEEMADIDEQAESEQPKEESVDEEADKIQGLDGNDNGQNADDVDNDAAAEKDSGIKSEGADAGIEQEDQNVGGEGGAASMPEDKQEQQPSEKPEEEPHADSTRDEASESLKQLGDSLKEFHRRRQDIKESTEDTVDQKAGERPDEFQHLDSASSENQTQALGAADKDQLQSIDEEMAIDDEMDQDNEDESEQDKADAQDAQEGAPDANQENQEPPSGQKSGPAEQEDGVPEEEKRSGAIQQGGDMAIDTAAEAANDLAEPHIKEEDFGPMESIPIQKVSETRSYQEAQELWSKADEQTRDLTAGLSEQLRLILEPTLATKLRGDYKTGKRLNMKRIIPYIASQFRKDKIWMRRTKPSKREYQIMIAVDDSKSMAESNAVDIAFQSISLVSKALTQLESGELSIAKFGEDAEIVHPFERPFNTEAGVKTFQNFTFESTRTDVAKLVGKSLGVFEQARSTAGDSDQWQLQIILSDGVCEDHAALQRLVRKAWEEKIMIVFVVIDGVNSEESILDMSQVNYVPDANGQMQLKVSKYLDTFPFQYYVVVHNIKELPEMLALILRQYFTEIAA